MMLRKFFSILLLTAALGAALGLSTNAFAGGDAAKGKASYSTFCVSCHGPGGAGDGVAAAALDPKPRNLTDASYVSGLSDDHLFNVIKNGGPAAGKSPMMPAWGGALADSDIHNVIAFIRSDVCKCKAK